MVSCDFQERLVDFEKWHFLSSSHWLVFEWEGHLLAGDTILSIDIFLGWALSFDVLEWKVTRVIHFTVQSLTKKSED